VSTRVTRDPSQAAAVLARGGLVALPTETVYGLAADVTRTDAVRRIFAVKGRPTDHPLIVHIADPDDLVRWSTAPSPAARRLAALAWPGPLSVIVPRDHRIADTVTGGRDTVAVRCPAHDLARDVIRRLGRPVAAPSANRFGRVSPTTAQHVIDDLGDDVDLVLDGGPCSVGLESTIVDCTVDPVQILRHGGLPAEQVAALLEGPVAPASGPLRAPGMLEVHYAPSCRVHPVETAADAADLTTVLSQTGAVTAYLDLSGDVVRAARDLYGALRDADRQAATDLVVVLPRAAGLGVAVRDRVSRAAAGR